MTLSLTLQVLRTAYLRDVPSGAQEDYQLQRFLDEAESAVEAALGWLQYAAWPSAAARDVLVSAEGNTWLVLPPHQAGSVSAVVLGDTTLTVDDDYTLSDDGRALYRSSSWGVAGSMVEVTAVWGYGPAPAAAQRLAYELAVNFWRGRDQGMYSAVQGAEDGGRVIYTGGLNSTHRQIITNLQRPYRSLIV